MRINHFNENSINQLTISIKKTYDKLLKENEQNEKSKLQQWATTDIEKNKLNQGKSAE
jgi:hypothetical protein